MNYKTKRAASAKLGKRVAAAAASVALIGASVPAAVLSAAVPTVAYAATSKVAAFGLSFSFEASHIAAVVFTYAGDQDDETVTFTKDNNGKFVTDDVVPGSAGLLDFKSVKFTPELAYEASKVTGSNVAADVDGSLTYTAAALAAANSDALEVTGEGLAYKDGKKYADVAVKAFTLETSLTANPSAGVFSVSVALADGTESDKGSILYYAEGAETSTDEAGATKFNVLDHIEITPADGYHLQSWVAADLEDVPTATSFSTSEVLTRDDVLGQLNEGVDDPDDNPITAIVEANDYTVKLNVGDGKLSAGKATAKGTVDDNASLAALEEVRVKAPTDYAIVAWTATDEDGNVYKFETINGSFDLDGAVTAYDEDGAELAEQPENQKSALDILSGTEDGATVELTAVYELDEAAEAEVFLAGDVAAGGVITLSDGSAYVAETDISEDLADATAKANDGYAFGGWYATTTGEWSEDAPLVTEDATITAVQMRDNVQKSSATGAAVATTYVAHFMKDSTTVSYDANGGTLAEDAEEPAAITYKAGDGLANVLTTGDEGYANDIWEKNGYIIVGWSTNKDAKEGDEDVLTDDNADEQLLSEEGDKVLYAVWSQEEGAIVANFKAEPADGGSVSKDQIAATALASTDFVEATANDGYSFVAWFVRDTDGDDTQVVDADGEDYDGAKLTRTILIANGVAADAEVNFVAKFRGNSYTAIFDGEQVALTVGEDAEIPEGEWVTKDGTKVASKAELDALATTDGAVIQLTKAQPETPETPESPTTPTTPESPVEPVLHEGWNDPTGNGEWCYVKDGKKVANDWVFDGAWYYFDSEGLMQVGWVWSGGEWYYMSEAKGSGTYGHMTTGSQFDGKAWYYLNDGVTSQPTGAMVRNVTAGGYKYGADGKWIA